MPRALSRAGRRPATTVTGEGIVLTRAGVDAVASWAKRGLGVVVLLPRDGWTLVVPGGRPRARHPYDDAVRTLAGRPVSRRMRPAVGFFRVGRQAVVTVQSRRRLSPVRWLIWTPWDGVVAPRGLPVARPVDVARAVGVDDPGATALVEEILSDVGATADQILTALLGVLHLPGVDVLTDQAQAGVLPGARSVTPAARYARAFDRIVRERRELAGDAVDEDEGVGRE